MDHNSVAAARPRSPHLRKRGQNELVEVEKVAKTHACRHAVMPPLREEPVGAPPRLLELAAYAIEAA